MQCSDVAGVRYLGHSELSHKPLDNSKKTAAREETSFDQLFKTRCACVDTNAL
jgi:hypothetical protein